MSRSIPKALREAILRRDNYTCVKCGYQPPDQFYLQLDHIHPYSQGGTTTYDNLQTLCGKCNNYKRDKRPECPRCRKFVVANAPLCPYCGTRLPKFEPPQSKVSNQEKRPSFTRTLIIGAAAAAGFILILFVASFGTYLFSSKGNSSQASSDSNVSNLINQTININPSSAYPIQFTIPEGATSGRVAGGFKVTSGAAVNVLVMDSRSYQNWKDGAQASPLYETGPTASLKVNRKLDPGNYYLVFSNQSSDSVSVAAEFYVGHK